MIKIVLAFDSFKGSLSAHQACAVAESALLSLKDDRGQSFFSCKSLPMADGGEGTVDAFLTACGGHKVGLPVTGPYGQPIQGFYGVLPDQTVVIEMAAASGLTLPQNLFHPLEASTVGTGELILHALETGYTNFIVGLGGSATNDGGMGMAHSLGVRFLDAAHQELPPRASNLKKIRSICLKHLHPAVSDSTFVAACDVKNPLYGPNGASVVFGPQKGASPSDVQFLDQSLQHYGDVLTQTFHKDFSGEGSGAAGGLGAAMMAFLNATYVSGIDLLLNQAKVDHWLTSAHYLITGEGQLDHQSLMGKVVSGLMARAQKSSVPLISFPGLSALTASDLIPSGLAAVYPIKKADQSLQEAMSHAEENLYAAILNWGRQQCLMSNERAPSID